MIPFPYKLALSMQLRGMQECSEYPWRGRILEHFGTRKTAFGDIKFCAFVVPKFFLKISTINLCLLDPRPPTLQGLQDQQLCHCVWVLQIT